MMISRHALAVVVAAIMLLTAFESAHAGSIAYVAGAQTIYRIDIETGTVLGTMATAGPLGGGVWYQGLRLSADGKTLVASAGTCCDQVGDPGRVLLFDTATAMERASISVGARPRVAAITLDSTLAYVPAQNSNRIEVIDLVTGTLVRSISVASRPSHVALTSDQSLLAVDHDPAGLGNAFVTSVSTVTETTVATASVHGSGDILDTVAGTRTAWVSTNEGVTLRVVDLETGAFIGGSIAVGTGGYVKAQPQGDIVAVTGEGNGSESQTLYLFDVSSGTKIGGAISLPGIGYGMDFTADGGDLVTALYGGGSALHGAAIIDVATRAVTFVSLPESAFYVAVQTIPEPATILLVGLGSVVLVARARRHRQTRLVNRMMC